MVCGYAVGYVLQQYGLARFGRRNYQPPLSSANGGQEHDETGRQAIFGYLQVDELLGKYGGELLERGPPFCHVWINAVDRLDAEEAIVLFSVLGGPHLPRHVVARAQAEAPNLGLGDVDIVDPVAEPIVPQEAVSVIDQLQDTAADDLHLTIRAHRQEPEYQLLLFHVTAAVDVGLFGQINQLVSALLLQVCYLDAVARCCRGLFLKHGVTSLPCGRGILMKR